MVDHERPLAGGSRLVAVDLEAVIFSAGDAAQEDYT
jgi:hypothetical protein